MTSVDVYMTALGGAVAAGLVARWLLAVRLKSPPSSLMKTNVRGLQVPAVIGGPLTVASLAVMGAVAILGTAGWTPARATSITGATALVLVAMTIAGSWDDRRGDERPRGFAGHIGAARSGSVTGGVVKLVAGAVAGLAAGLVLVADGVARFPADRAVWGVMSRWPAVIAIGAVVALSANLVNLFDRAPGRAGKVTLMVAAPLAVFGEPAWIVAASPVVGALVGCLPYDLRERAMLGDAGANPLGAVVGLGIAVSLPTVVSVAGAALALLALNLASEKWSFSRAIEATPWLKAVDKWGRPREPSSE